MPAICINHYYAGGTPLFWRRGDDRLHAAVSAWLVRRETESERHLFCLYLRHYIGAPCWDAAIANACRKDALSRCVTFKAMLDLRQRAVSLSTRDEIRAWLHDALEFGIDPL